MNNIIQKRKDYYANLTKTITVGVPTGAIDEEGNQILRLEDRVVPDPPLGDLLINLLAERRDARLDESTLKLLELESKLGIEVEDVNTPHEYDEKKFNSEL